MSDQHYLKDELYELIKNDDTIFEFLQSASLDGMWYWDLENLEHEWMNAKFWTTLGYDPATMPHRADAWQDIINQDDLQVALDNFQKHLADPNHPYDQVVRYCHKDGSTVWIRCRGLAIRDETGKPVRMLGAHNDITALKEAEERQRQNVEAYQTIINNQKAYIIRTDAEGNYTYANDLFLERFNLEYSAIIGTSSMDTIFVDDHTKTYDTALACLENPHKPFAVTLRKLMSDGSYKTTNWEFTGITDTQGNASEILCIGVDVTKQVEAEAELQRTAALLEKAQRIANMGGWEIDTITDKVTITQQVYNIYELPSGAPFDISIGISFYHPEDQAIITDALNQAIEQQMPFDVQCRLITAKGNHRWVRSSGYPVVENGQVIRLVGILQDITNDKQNQQAMQATLEQLEQTLAQNNMLMKEIHHRVKNNLAVISALLSLRASGLDDPAAKEALQESRDRIKVMAEVHELMYQHDSQETIAFDSYLSGLVTRMQHSFGDGKQPITFELEVAETELSIDHAIPLGLIINELLTNAVKYAFPLDQPDPRVTITTVNGEGLTVVVTDNGVGLAEDTTLETGNSLGMTVINSLTEQLEGQVMFENHPRSGVGLQVTLHVPLAK